MYEAMCKPRQYLRCVLCASSHHWANLRRIMEACAVKMFRSSLGPNTTDAATCLKKYDHAKSTTQMAFIKKYNA